MVIILFTNPRDEGPCSQCAALGTQLLIHDFDGHTGSKVALSPGFVDPACEHDAIRPLLRLHGRHQLLM
jgi:hypothetical protein